MSHPRILIVKLSSLGDILHVLPTVQALHDQLGAVIDWAVQPEYAQLVNCFGVVDQVIPVPRHGLPGVFYKTLSGIRRPLVRRKRLTSRIFSSSVRSLILAA